MQSLVVYDSMFGNTQKVAETIASTLKAKSVRVGDFKPEMLSKIDLIVVGCPIQGWRPTQAISDFLNKLPKDSLKNKSVAAFDTRIKIFFSGSASDKISDALENMGSNIIIAPTNFIVKGKEGPLLDGELDKASAWAKEILTKLNG
jgi:flavodoxin